MKDLLDNGLLHGDCMTVTGKTVFANLECIDAESIHKADIRVRILFTLGSLFEKVLIETSRYRLVMPAAPASLRYDVTSQLFSFWLHSMSRSGVGKLRPLGRIRPSDYSSPA